MNDVLNVVHAYLGKSFFGIYLSFLFYFLGSRPRNDVTCQAVPTGSHSHENQTARPTYRPYRPLSLSTIFVTYHHLRSMQTRSANPPSTTRSGRSRNNSPPPSAASTSNRKRATSAADTAAKAKKKTRTSTKDDGVTTGGENKGTATKKGKKTPRLVPFPDFFCLRH
jgi:hypothetical protein